MDIFEEKKFKVEYELGKKALSEGEYGLSVQHLEAASKLITGYSPQSDSVKIWLVTAYQAAGMLPEAIALCRELAINSNLETRKQAKHLLYIMEAPQLNRPKEWMTEIPDLTAMSESDSQYLGSSSSKSNPSTRIEEVDLKEVNRSDNQFIWVALLGIIIILGGFIWFG